MFYCLRHNLLYNDAEPPTDSLRSRSTYCIVSGTVEKDAISLTPHSSELLCTVGDDSPGMTCSYRDPLSYSRAMMAERNDMFLARLFLLFYYPPPPGCEVGLTPVVWNEHFTSR